MQHGIKREWREYWTLPVAAAIGYSTAVLHTYGLGPFIEPLEAEFGWGRSAISAGIAIAGFIGALFSIPLGMAVDRVGPRRVALTGVVLMTGAFAMLGAVGSDIWQWYAIWCLVGFGNLFLQATVWTSAITSRFEASRGLAIAVTLSGGAITATVLPIIATSLIESHGWRAGFAAIGAMWAAVVFPVLYFLFHGKHDAPGQKRADVTKRDKTPRGLSAAMAMPAFYQLLLASAFFTLTGIGMIVHFVPILVEFGADPLGAAGVASLIGVTSIIGRLSTGLLLDRFPPGLVGALVFLMPLTGSLLLLFAGSETVAQTIAAACFGFAVGAEIDVIAFLVSRCFGLQSYGSIFGAMVGAMALGSAAGPVAAGAVHDAFAGYAPFLVASAVLLAIGAVALGTLKVPPAAASG